MRILELHPVTWERMIRAVETVKDRLYRAAAALKAGGHGYAIIGGNAVGAWVSQVEEGAERNTPDVNILVRRGDLAAIRATLDAAGFIHSQLLDKHMLLDGPTAGPRDAVHVIFANEKVKPTDPVETLDVTDSMPCQRPYRVVSLEGLVRMKLVAYRLKDRVHLQDMLNVGLLDDTWPARFPQSILADRMREVLANPDG